MNEIRLNTILAAVDINDALANRVLGVAALIAQKMEGSLHVVSIVPEITASAGSFAVQGAPDIATSPIVAQELANSTDAARTYNDRFLQFISDANLTVKVESAESFVGRPIPDIIEHTRTLKADLLVIGSQQRGFWERLVQGSTSQAVAKESDCSVLLVNDDNGS